MCSKEEVTNFTLSGKPQKLEDQFTYLVSNISSTEIDVNLSIEKAWTAIESLPIIWKSDLSDKIKRDFFQAVPWMHHVNSYETHREKARWVLHKNAGSYFEQILKAAPNKTTAIWPITSHLTNHPRKTNKNAGHWWGRTR